MDNSDYSRNRHNEHLGVNKIGKHIKKSPMHQPNFVDPAKQQPQPQVYNINKNDFRNIVQQLTGSPSHHSQEPLSRPPLNPPKLPSMRLQRIRPPPLTPINANRPRMLIHPPHRPPAPRGGVPFNGQAPLRPVPPPPMSSGDHTGWTTTVESPISAYMRYLQHSINDSTQGHPQQHQSSGLLPSPRMNDHPSLLPSPTSQLLLSSPSSYLNLSSPRSPNLPFSPMAQSGILGPGPQPPPSPGIGFPLSPGFFWSPRWRD